MKMSDLFETEGYSHEVGTQIALFHRYRDDFKKLMSTHAVMHNMRSVGAYKHHFFPGQRIYNENTALPKIQKVIGWIEKLAQRAAALKPDLVRQSLWHETADYLYQIGIFLQEAAHKGAFSYAPFLDMYKHVEENEIPIDGIEDHTHLGNDMSGEMYVWKNKADHPHAVELEQLYALLERVRTTYHDFKDSCNEMDFDARQKC